MSRRSKSRRVKESLVKRAEQILNEDARSSALRSIGSRFSPGDRVTFPGDPQQYMVDEHGSLRKVTSKFLEKRRLKLQREQEKEATAS